MKALLLVNEADDKIKLADIDQFELPTEGNYALVKMQAAALNRRDQWCREGKYPGIQYGVALGSDGCGVVEQVNNAGAQWVGKTVVINPNINWGDNPAVQSDDYRILGMPDNGTFAEYCVVPIDRLHEKPAHLKPEEAAALPLGGLTAYRAAFTHGQVAEGKNVLITGIGGGVSQLAFLFANAVNANIYVTSGNEKKMEFAKYAGAVEAFNYKADNWHKAAMKASGGFDVIIDSGGGDAFGLLAKLLRPAGKLVFYGATAGLPSGIDLFRLFWAQGTIQGSTMGNDQEFAAMLQFVAKHQLIPVVDSVRPFAEIVNAFNAMKNNQQTGKLVVSF